MITAAQLRAARVLLGIDQRRLAELSGPFRANHSAHGGERNDGAGQCQFAGQADRGFRRGRHRDDRRRSRQPFAGARRAAETRIPVRPGPIWTSDRRTRRRAERGRAHDARPSSCKWSASPDCWALAVLAIVAEPRQGLRRPSSTARRWRFPRSHWSVRCARCLAAPLNGHRSDLADRIAVARRPFPPGRAGFVFPCRRQSRRRGGKPLRSRLRPSRAGAAPRAAVLPRLPGRHESGGAGGRRVFLPAVLGIHVAGVLGAGHGAPPRSRQRQGGLRLSRDGKLRHAGAAAGLRPAGGTGGRLRICRHSRRAAYAVRGRRWC